MVPSSSGGFGGSTTGGGSFFGSSFLGSSFFGSSAFESPSFFGSSFLGSSIGGRMSGMFSGAARTIFASVRITSTLSIFLKRSSLFGSGLAGIGAGGAPPGPASAVNSSGVFSRYTSTVAFNTSAPSVRSKSASTT